MAFDFSRLAPVFAGLSGPEAAINTFQMQQEQREREAAQAGQQQMAGLVEQIFASPDPQRALWDNASQLVGHPDGLAQLTQLQELIKARTQQQQPEYMTVGSDVLMTDPTKPGTVTKVYEGMPTAMKELTFATGGNVDAARELALASEQAKIDLMKAQTGQMQQQGAGQTMKERVAARLVAEGVIDQRTADLYVSGVLDVKPVNRRDVQGNETTEYWAVPNVPGMPAQQIGGIPGLPEPSQEGLVQPTEGAQPTIAGFENPTYGSAAAVLGAGVGPMAQSAVGGVARQAGAQGTDVGLAAKNRRAKINQYKAGILALREAGRIPAADAKRLTDQIAGEGLLDDPLSATESWMLVRREMEDKLRNATAEVAGALDPETRSDALKAAQAYRGFLSTFPTFEQLDAVRGDIQSGAINLSPAAAEEEMERGVREATQGPAPMVNSQADFDKLPSGAEFTYKDEQGNVKRGRKN